MSQLLTIVSNINKLPSPLKGKTLSMFFGRVIPFAGTSGIQIEELGQERSVLVLKNKKRVQNHIKGVHAAAMALLAESATGFLCGMNCPDDKLLLIKSMNLNYVRRAKGNLTAVAELSEAERQLMINQDKGEVSVKITVTDEDNKEPVECEMIWAWVPKKRS
ncbi:DUF4442 domain-containing protein [Litoribrevibacter albus]|uniref:DUF4442 domain-containing protein n=1 Tax=Litoribrevibacter albus TaxID=1473156 RepID=A0AA37W9D8_9GAMM|nr:DUF4442 domain-containing protein [Litoribrevibacter albus]GLQ33284.1 hypothetical protein GCM10007876_37640 [Litoribrevibacter albus]